MIINSHISQLDSMYPAANWMLNQQTQSLPEYTKWGSLYGYSFGASTITIGNKTHELESNQYFSLFIGNNSVIANTTSQLFLVVRLGYKCQNTIGWTEEKGRLTYIDGCTDSLLVYPPRMGDPSLSLLHFPSGIDQSQHTHPSIRIGCVIGGQGVSDTWSNGAQLSHDLVTGVNFCLEENELHRFRTIGSSMTVIAWHPDGDWGPTDHNHTMLNRTYINK
jgi:quercetin dioxygenase-like cupin family protein